MYLRFDIVGQTAIQEQHGPITPASKRSVHGLFLDKILPKTCGGHRDISTHQTLVKFLHREVVIPERLRFTFGAPAVTGQRNLTRTRSFQLPHDEIGNLAKADHQHTDIFQIAMNVTRDLGRGRRDGNRTLADRRLRADPLRSAIGRLKELTQLPSDHTGSTSRTVPFANLPKDLRLSNNLAVEGRCNREYVTHGRFIDIRIDGAVQGLRRAAAKLVQQAAEDINGLFGLPRCALKLDPVAGRQDHRLGDALVFQTRIDTRLHVFVDKQPIPKKCRSRFMIDANGEYPCRLFRRHDTSLPFATDISKAAPSIR